MSLTLRQLEVFLAAAQDGNFRRTADRLGVSQPSISGRIKSLEAYLGYDLFDRSSGVSPRLTTEGEAFVAKARQLMSGATQLSTPRRRRPTSSPLRLKALIGPWLLQQRLIPALSAFCCENPGVEVDFVPLGITVDGAELIGSGKADICLYTGDAPEDPSFDIELIATTGCSIFGAPELLDRVGTTLDAISAAPFILPPEHHPPGGWVRARLAAVGICPGNIVARSQFPDLVVQMMVEGRGLSVFYDEFMADRRLRKTGPPLTPASRVMLVGARARRPAAAPVLDFLRRVGAASGEARCQ
jgi:DNA-binding transcriptional LysR family regulator